MNGIKKVGCQEMALRAKKHAKNSVSLAHSPEHRNREIREKENRRCENGEERRSEGK